MSSKNSGETLYNYCMRLINSGITEDIDWGKQLLSEWEYELNKDLCIDIHKVMKGSHLKAYWKCNEGHIFKKQIVARTGRDLKHRDKCRICAYNERGRKTKERALRRHTLRDWCKTNKFGDIILKEFDTERNNEIGITLDNITPFSTTELFWKCDKGHRYKAFLNNKTAVMTGCPFCVCSGTSYFEQLLYFIFKDLYKDTISRGKVKYKGANVEFDITIPEIKLCIEYGTDYTHPNNIESPLKLELCNKCAVDLVYIHSSNTKDEIWSKNIIIFKQKWHRDIDDAIKIVDFILRTRGIDSSVLRNIDYDAVSALAYEYSHGKIEFKDSLAYHNSELCKEWDYSKNISKPEDFKKFSNKKVWWLCNKCGHSWKATILNRNYNMSGCPNCNTTR